jgi:hypothetical protein
MTDLQKNRTKFHKITLFPGIFFLFFVLFACGNRGSSPPAEADFFGTWKNSNGVIRTISADKIVASIGTYGRYTLSISSWTPASNDNAETKGDYPAGYTIAGTISAKTGDIHGLPDIGNSHSHTYYLHTGKQSFSSDGNDGAAIFTKQP